MAILDLGCGTLHMPLPFDWCTAQRGIWVNQGSHSRHSASPLLPRLPLLSPQLPFPSSSDGGVLLACPGPPCSCADPRQSPPRDGDCSIVCRSAHVPHLAQCWALSYTAHTAYLQIRLSDQMQQHAPVIRLCHMHRVGTESVRFRVS
jgi:hypothetical protein